MSDDSMKLLSSLRVLHLQIQEQSNLYVLPADIRILMRAFEFD